MFSNLNCISDMGLTLSIPDDVSDSTSVSTRTRTSAGWISRGATLSSKRQRTYTLRDWTTANTPPNAQYSPLPKYVPLYADQLIKQIKTKKIDLYETANNMINYKQAQQDAPNTIISYRLKLLKYFRFMHLKPDEDEYNDTVTKIQKGNLQSDGPLDEDIITSLLEHSTPKYRAIFYLLITGARPGEISSLKIQDIDFKSTPARVTFEPLSTKTKEPRTTFLSTEAVQRIIYYLRTRATESQWLFPGFTRDPNTNKKTDSNKPISSNSAYMMIQQQFDNLELKQSISHKGTSRRKYHPKVFRTWATNFLKDHEYPADWAEIEAGHKLGVPDHYKPTLEQRAKKWQELIEPHMHFLTPTPPPKGSQQDRITELKTELKLHKNRLENIEREAQHVPQEWADLSDQQFNEYILFIRAKREQIKDPQHPLANATDNQIIQAIKTINANESSIVLKRHQIT